MLWPHSMLVPFCLFRLSYGPLEVVRVSFGCPRIPLVEARASFSIDQWRPLKKLSITNINWSESNPFGLSCSHSVDAGAGPSEWCVPRGIRYKLPTASTKIGRVEYVGLPDAALKNIVSSRAIIEPEWFQMSPVNVPRLDAPRKVIRADLLQSLTICALLRVGDPLPAFTNTGDLRNVTLYALAGSNTRWSIQSLFLQPSRLRKLETLNLHGSHKRLLEPQLSPTSEDFRFVSRDLKALSINDYCPVFIQQIRPNRIFSSLEKLTIDISHIKLTDPSTNLLRLHLSSRFPKLKALVVQCPFHNVRLCSFRLRQDSWMASECWNIIPALHLNQLSAHLHRAHDYIEKCGHQQKT